MENLIKLNRQDFCVHANSRGYQVLYKGCSIGGAGSIHSGSRHSGIGPRAKAPAGRAAAIQVQEYLKSGRREINKLITCNQPAYMMRNILKLEQPGTKA